MTHKPAYSLAGRILPTEDEILSADFPLTKGELAKQIYGDLTLDHALPQDWVNAQNWDCVPWCVWLYPEGYAWGTAGPLTVEAAQKLGYAVKCTWRVL